MREQSKGCDGEGCPQTLCSHLGEGAWSGPAVLMKSQDQLVMASEQNPATTSTIPGL